MQKQGAKILFSCWNEQKQGAETLFRSTLEFVNRRTNRNRDAACRRKLSTFLHLTSAMRIGFWYTFFFCCKVQKYNAFCCCQVQRCYDKMMFWSCQVQNWGDHLLFSCCKKKKKKNEKKMKKLYFAHSISTMMCCHPIFASIEGFSLALLCKCSFSTVLCILPAKYK